MDRRLCPVLACAALLVGCRHAEPVPGPPAASHDASHDAPHDASVRRSAEWDAALRSFLHDQKFQLQNCFEQELRRVEDAAAAGAYRDGEPVPPLAGTLKLRVAIEPDGSVADARVEDDTLGNANVRECLVSRARRWWFARHPAGEQTELEIPFRSSVSGPPDAP